MKKFLTDIFVILTFVGLFFLFICFYLDGIGWSDWAYKKLISEGNCKSMITGTSRAEQGIIPFVIDSIFDLKSKGCPMQNFAFTGESSPYGEVYYNAINRKIDRRSRNGLFVVSVEPWSLTLNSTSDAVSDGYREDFQVLNIIQSYYKPNFSYIWNYRSPFMFYNPNMKLHDDGWLEIMVSMNNYDVQIRKESKKADYKELNYKKSDYRIKWLKKTIELFEKHGKVIMCRIPTDGFFLDVENIIWPNFDSEMYDIAKKYDIQYITFTDKVNYYRTTDGNHLYKEDAIKFTMALCDSISAKVPF